MGYAPKLLDYDAHHTGGLQVKLDHLGTLKVHRNLGHTGIFVFRPPKNKKKYWQYGPDQNQSEMQLRYFRAAFSRSLPNSYQQVKVSCFAKLLRKHQVKNKKEKKTEQHCTTHPERLSSFHKQNHSDYTHTYQWLLNSTTCRGRGHPRYVSHWGDHLRDYQLSAQ